MNKIRNSLYIAWTIAVKDIRDGLTNKATRTNILVLIGLVLFFYWASTIRPFDDRVDVVIYNQADSNLDFKRTTLADGSELDFQPVSSLAEMEKRMEYQDVGIVIPANAAEEIESSGELNLAGYVHWVKRGQIADLEGKYSAMFSELLGVPVSVEIGDNILVPLNEAPGTASTAAFHVFFAIIWMAVAVVPFLILEERQTRTIDALMVSPASPGQVVFGKAIAGLIFVTAIAGLSLALNGIYVTSWGWALLGFLITAIFSIGLALLFGSSVRSSQHITLWMLPIALILIVPALFANEPNLTPAAKSVIDWIPTTAFSRILTFSVTGSALFSSVLTNLAIAGISIAVIYSLVVMQIRRADR